jgi:hypothetical protein
VPHEIGLAQHMLRRDMLVNEVPPSSGFATTFGNARKPLILLLDPETHR